MEEILEKQRRRLRRHSIMYKDSSKKPFQWENSKRKMSIDVENDISDEEI